MATRVAKLPGWMKTTLWGAGVLVALAILLMALGHNPLQHLSDHSGMSS